ncbi:MAG TPA: hypothetical protein VGX37_13395 [Allosphingosinicella sp.]|nr:hypothetical protein [Allosphingosinicella sp.]
MGRIFAFAVAALALCGAASASAQAIVASVRPDAVAVTVYRDPNRSPEQAPNLEWLNGYALISETRQVSIPAGESVVRFEGVASGILPQTAIVSGFAEGIVERNRDAYLLSPGTLLDRSLGRRVHLRRTSLATGAVREQEAIIRSSADGAVVLQTADGFEALRCTGIPETLVYDEVPAELASTPTLSVRVRSSAPLSAAVTLSYLASNFDWQANYIATLSEDGERADLLAWLTLASNDDTSFPDASTQAVAGQLNRENARAEPAEARSLELRCWPQASTSDIPLQDFGPPPPPPPPPAMADEAIVVTGSRIQTAQLTANSPVTMIAEQEALGDVKLYRIPEPVTVAANSQKQVAFLTRDGVRVRMTYRRRVSPADVGDPQPAQRLLVSRNRTEEGLGIPLPAGRLVLFTQAAQRPILIGEGFVRDRAVGEDVEIELGEASGVFTQIELVEERKRENRYRLVVTNDQARPVRFEAEFEDSTGFRPGRRLGRRDGRPLWTVTVPAHGRAVLRYRLPVDNEDEDD